MSRYDDPMEVEPRGSIKIRETADIVLVKDGGCFYSQENRVDGCDEGEITQTEAVQYFHDLYNRVLVLDMDGYILARTYVDEKFRLECVNSNGSIR